MSVIASRPTVALASRRARRGLFGIWGLRLLIIALVLIVLLPAYYVVEASLQPGSSAFSSSLIPSAVSLDNYKTIFDAGFWIWLKNSAIVCTVAGVLGLIINTMGAFAFSRLRFPGRKYGLMSLLVLQMFPMIVAIPAIYTLLIYFNLLDRLWGLILVYLGASAFNMWLIKNYMDSIPRELDESATVDGAGTWAIFWRILLPLMRPMLATIFIYSFNGAYNDFVFASFVLQSQDNWTITVGLYHTITANIVTNWAQFAAGAVLASIPICAVFLGLQKQLVSGLAQGAVKG